MIQTRWTEFLRQSGNTARFSWLSDFSTTVDDIIFKQVTSPSATNIPPYDPFLLEVNISNASTLLDRCLIYRKEMYDLEEQGVRRVLEYTLYDNQRDAQRTLELAENIEEQRKAERDGQAAASAIFATAKDNVLATGFKAIADATESSADTAWQYERDVRKKAVLTKWNALDEYQQTLEARHLTPGNALNYKERRSRVQKLLERDALNAFLRLRCIAQESPRFLIDSILP